MGISPEGGSELHCPETSGSLPEQPGFTARVTERRLVVTHGCTVQHTLLAGMGFLDARVFSAMNHAPLGKVDASAPKQVRIVTQAPHP
jgi:hypothetical protein